ncbi:hypothetical protein K491DRAFT_777011 [Lophiostoma macrostomum CBS 122681]|uniref:Uncharacterized protein n=1 Tax=Lophiostoma macrostomum CBS 122681 TaxID=1314788 RepID=A0A6A6TF52_9PLEO|nr:hypothetical protein K491DRAFT_777011 [Lophiostoma macrostomum CBS 122681]
MTSAALKALYTPSASRSRSSLTYHSLHNHEMKLLIALLRSYPTPYNANKDSEYWLGIDYLIHALPHNLRSSSIKLSKTEDRDGKVKPGKLCSGHNELNQGLIYSIWSSLRFEFERGVGRFLYPIIMHAGLPLALETKVRQLEPVLQMWQPDFDGAANTLEGREPIRALEAVDGLFVPRWQYQENACPACMLARLGDDRHVLSALFAGMVGRLPSRSVGTRDNVRSKRVRWVRYWLKKFPDGVALVEEAWDLGMELKRVRKAWKEHQRTRRGSGIYAGGKAQVQTRFEDMSLRGDDNRVGIDVSDAFQPGFTEAGTERKETRRGSESVIPVDFSDPFVPPHIKASMSPSTSYSPRPSADDASSIYSRTTCGHTLYQDSSIYLPATPKNPHLQPRPHIAYNPTLETLPSPRRTPTVQPSRTSLHSQQAHIENCDDYAWDTDCSSYDSTYSEKITHNHRTHGHLAPAPLRTGTPEEFLVLPRPNRRSIYGGFVYGDGPVRSVREEYDGYDVSPPGTPLQGRSRVEHAERMTKWSDLY